MQIDLTAARSMIDQARDSATRAPHVRRPWLHLLSAVLQLAGGKVELLRHAEQPWASATFSGSRHTIALSFTGEDAIAAGEAFLEALPDHEFSLPRHIVADAAVSEVEHILDPAPKLTVEVELLLLEDD